MPQTLVDLFRHNRWANLVLVDACALLQPAQLAATVPGALGPVVSTLWHIAKNEEAYAATIASEARPAQPPAQPSLAELRGRLSRAGTRLVELAGSLEPGSILRGEWQGQPYEMPASVPLLQAINHGTEHRGQITLALTSAGVTPPALDIWAWSEAGMP
jgi:uncharacterized damage-inducible protein DinB